MNANVFHVSFGQSPYTDADADDLVFNIANANGNQQPLARNLGHAFTAVFSYNGDEDYRDKNPIIEHCGVNDDDEELVSDWFFTIWGPALHHFSAGLTSATPQRKMAAVTG